MMISLLSPSKAQRKIKERVREKRLELNLTQEGLSERSGVPLATLRKFEQKGMISLESFLKLLMALGMLESVVKAIEMEQKSFQTIEEVLAPVPKRKRGGLK